MITPNNTMTFQLKLIIAVTLAACCAGCANPGRIKASRILNVQMSLGHERKKTDGLMTRYIKFREPHVKAEMEASKKLMTAAKKHLMKDFNMDPSELEALIKEAFPAPSSRRLVEDDVFAKVDVAGRIQEIELKRPKPVLKRRERNPIPDVMLCPQCSRTSEEFEDYYNYYYLFPAEMDEVSPTPKSAVCPDKFHANTGGPSRRRLVKGNVAKQIEKYEKMSKKKYTGPARPKMVMRDANTGEATSRRRLVKGNVAKQIEKYEKMSKKKYTGPARPKMVMRDANTGEATSSRRLVEDDVFAEVDVDSRIQEIELKSRKKPVLKRRERNPIPDVMLCPQCSRTSEEFEDYYYYTLVLNAELDEVSPPPRSAVCPDKFHTHTARRRRLPSQKDDVFAEVDVDSRIQNIELKSRKKPVYTRKERIGGKYPMRPAMKYKPKEVSKYNVSG